MASIFKNKTIKDRLENFVVPDFDKKIDTLKKWHEAYKDKSLHKNTETQCEQAYNKDIFIGILGYKDFPSKPRTIIPKGSTEASGQRADAVLGYFTEDMNKVVAVVEIKDADTLLDKSQQREGNLSPVQQAFKYKPQYKNCPFVIATNFYEFRLLTDNQLDYEIFTLDSLVNPDNNYFEFRKFYFLLNAENFITKAGKSRTEELLSEIRIEQEKITKAFYGLYKNIRLELLRNLYKNNKKVREDFPFGIQKAQKIIDRIIFVCFCEDMGLLPDHTLQKVIESKDTGFSSLWDLLKGFFNALDNGSEKLEIPVGFDGGLFAKDRELNELKIDDEVIHKFLELGKYDFEADLSVNILGHIFEQSITDLEELKQKVSPDEEEKKSSKRKKEGIYYTPDYIVDYIVRNSLGKLLEEKEQEIIKKHKLKDDILDINYKKREITAYQEYQGMLQNIKVLDPACGSGAFLVKVFDYLLAENIRVGNIIGGLFNTEDYFKSILQNNIYGVDLNNESVEITKLSLWLKSAQKNEQLTVLKDNIKCGNSLIDDPTIAGDKAFEWQKEFSEIINNGGFDVVIGNPPYVDSESMTKYLKEERDYLSKKYKSTKGNWDLYIPFIEKASLLININGTASLITPNKWLSMGYGSKIRFLLKDNLFQLSDFSGIKVFEDAGITSIIFFINKKINKKINIKIFNDNFTYTENEISKKVFSDLDNLGVYFSKTIDLIIKLITKNKSLSKFCDLHGAFTTSEAYDLIPHLVEEPKAACNYLKFINTGTIDRYLTLWEYQETTYIKINI